MQVGGLTEEIEKDGILGIGPKVIVFSFLKLSHSGLQLIDDADRKHCLALTGATFDAEKRGVRGGPSAKGLVGEYPFVSPFE